MEQTAVVEGNLKDLLNVMVSRAEKEVDALMPGYTHLQVSDLSLYTWYHLNIGNTDLTQHQLIKP